MTDLCCCGSGLATAHCCREIINGTRSAATATELMRSRYCAFVEKNDHYLVASHHSTTRPHNRERKELKQWMAQVEWLDLEILFEQAGGINDVEGIVEFRATYITGGLPEQLHERSRFAREEGEWKYVSGIHY